jgi:hypothetical protein
MTKAHNRPSGLPAKLHRRGRQDRNLSHREGVRELHAGEEGYWDFADKPACTFVCLLDYQELWHFLLYLVECPSPRDHMIP